MIYRRYVGFYVIYVWCRGVMCAITSSMQDVQALCGLLHLLCLIHMRYVGCHILYVGFYILYVGSHILYVGSYSLYMSCAGAM